MQCPSIPQCPSPCPPRLSQAMARTPPTFQLHVPYSTLRVTETQTDVIQHRPQCHILLLMPLSPDPLRFNQLLTTRANG